ncbi:hypothetical protein LEP3755_42800 [Leptolyngbya sp. NIES-3755]|nr:hypothetical protein LEP3755_42800 [Leptolyngbya sp. NIES-3755]
MNVLQYLSFRLRVSLALCGGLIVFFLLPSHLQTSTRLLATWAAAVSCFLFPVVLIILRTTPETTAYRARRFNLRRTAIFTIVATALSMIFIAFRLLKTTKEASTEVLALHLGISMLAILLSWFLLHTLFAQYYAALYYRPDSPGGIEFQEQDTPTDWDFLYFAFTLGATAQTSDTFITSRTVRRLALGQCLIAFWYFVGIVAMSVNLVSELL